MSAKGVFHEGLKWQGIVIGTTDRKYLTRKAYEGVKHSVGQNLTELRDGAHLPSIGLHNGNATVIYTVYAGSTPAPNKSQRLHP